MCELCEFFFKKCTQITNYETLYAHTITVCVFTGVTLFQEHPRVCVVYTLNHCFRKPHQALMHRFSTTLLLITLSCVCNQLPYLLPASRVSLCLNGILETCLCVCVCMSSYQIFAVCYRVQLKKRDPSVALAHISPLLSH